MIAVDEHIRSIIRGARNYSIPLEADEAFSRDENLLVRAGAGSGKTSVLIERMVALIRSGVPVDDLVAITFTRKAAAEMRGRFHDELLMAIGRIREEIEQERTAGEEERAELFGRELKLLFSASEAINGAFIDTIHAFCSLLLRAHPFASGLPAEFVILDPEQEIVLRRQFWNRYLAQVAKEDLTTLSALNKLGVRPNDLFTHFGDRCELSHVAVPSISVEEPDLTEPASAASEFLE